jgi:hypothetical protein
MCLKHHYHKMGLGVPYLFALIRLIYSFVILTSSPCSWILLWSRQFLELISVIGLSYSSNNITISMIICVEVIILSQFWLLHEMLHNLGVQLLYFILIFFLDCHQLWILTFLKFWMTIFLSILHLFYINYIFMIEIYINY